MSSHSYSKVLGTLVIATAVGLFLAASGTARADLTDDLIAYWAFDGDYTDSTGLGHDGTAGPGVSMYITDSILGDSCAQFDGVLNNAYVQAANGGDLAMGDPFTLSMWIKTSTVSGGLASKGSGGHDWAVQEKCIYIRDNGNVEFVGHSCGFNESVLNVTDNAWHHVVVAFSALGTAVGQQEIYIDGVNRTTTRAQAVKADSGTVFRLGWKETSDRGGYKEFDGLMDEVGFWTRQLSAAEVTELYNAGAGLNLFGTIDKTLTWDATVPVGDWGKIGPSNWTGGDPDEFPTLVGNDGDEAIIPSGDVTVAADRGAYSVDVSGVGTKLTIDSGSTLTLLTQADVDADAALTINGTLDTPKLNNAAVTTLGPGAKLIGGGTLAAVTTTGSATVEAAKAMTATDLNLAAGSTFTKAGDAKLSFTSGTNTIVPGDTVKVDAGELFMQAQVASNPLGGGTLVLDGGTYTAQGAVSHEVPGRLDMSGFMNPTDHVNNTDFNNDGDPGILDDVPVGTTTFTGLFDINGDAAFRALIPEITQNDNYQTLFTGKFKTTLAGGYYFQSTNKDDKVVIYIDLDKDGVFEHAGDLGTERVLEDNNSNTVTLDADTEYMIAFGHAEGTSGSRIRALFHTPAGGEVPATEVINLQDPDHQPFFLGLGIGAIDMSTSPVSVTDTSTLNAITDYDAAFGALSIDPGATLTTMGATGGMSFAGTTITGAGAVTLDTQTNTTADSINAGANVVTVTKTGAGDLVLNQAVATSTLAATSVIDVQEGRLVGTYKAAGPANPFGAADLKLGNGAEIVIDVDDHTPQTFDNALEVVGGGTLTAGLAAGAETITFGSAGKGVTLTSGTLKAQALLGHTLDLAGPLSSAGGALEGAGGTVKVTAGTPVGITTLSVTGGTMSIDAPVITTGGPDLKGGQLNYAWYNDVADSNLAAIDDGVINLHNGGLFDLTPTPEASWPAAVQGKAIWTDDVWQGGNMSDSYCQMWWGYFKPPQDGTYEFYVHGDDNEILFIDENLNGDFEINGIEDVTNNLPPEGWDNPRTGTIDLLAGNYYPFALAHSEGSGGDFVTVTIKEPDGTAIDINPGAQPTWWYSGIIRPNATLVSGGTLDINAQLTTGQLVVGGGGVVDSDAVVVTTQVTINEGGTYNANVLGSAGSDVIDIASGGRLNANITGAIAGQTANVGGALDVAADGATTGATINMLPGGYVNISFQQTTEANFPHLTLVGGSALSGDFTNADYNDWDDGDPKNVTLAVDAVLAAGVGTLPTRTEVLTHTGVGCALYQGIIDVANVAIYNFGDNGVDSIFKGGAFGSWTDAGNFEATVNDVSGPPNTGIEILMNGDVTVNGTTTLNTTDTARGAEFVGDGQLLIASAVATPLAGKTITRTGFFDPVDSSGKDTTGDYIVRLEDGAVGPSQTVKVTKGMASIRNIGSVAADPDGAGPLTAGTLVVGEHAMINIVDNDDGKRPNKGNYQIDAGGIVRINNNNRLKNGATFTFDPDAYIYFDTEIKINDADPNYVAGVNKGFDNVNIIITDDRYRQGLYLGEGRRLTTPSRQGQNTDVTGGNMGIIGPSLTAPPTYVIFSNANREDGHLEIRANVELPGVDVYINDPPGTLFSLPQHDNTLEREWVEMDGYVLWDEGTATFQNLDVRNGRLRLGENNNFNIVSDGSMTIRSGVEYVDLRANYNNLVPKLADGSLFPLGIFVENGSRFELRYRRDTGAGEEILQAITFVNVGSGLTTFQPNEENAGGNVYFKNITLADGVDVSVGLQDQGQKELHMDLTLAGTTATLSGDGCEIDSVTAPGAATVFIGNRAVDDGRGNDPSYAIGHDMSSTVNIFDIQEGHNNDGALQLYHGRTQQPPPDNNLYEWGDDAVIHVGYNESVVIRVDSVGNTGVIHLGEDGGPKTNATEYINQFNGYILVKNTEAGPDALLRGWRWGDYGADRGRVVFNNIHLEDGADVRYNENNCFVEFGNVYLEGPTGQISNYDGHDYRFRVGNIINNSGDPDAVVTLNARNRMRIYGTLGLDAIVVSNDVDGNYSDGNYGFHMVPGFQLNNHKLTITQGTDMHNRLWTDPGLGIIDFSNAEGGGPQLQLWYGNDQPAPGDPNELETVWGTDTTVLLGNDREFKIKVDRARLLGDRYWNTFAGPVIVKNNVAGDSDDADNARDGYLYVERHSNNGEGETIVGGHFANVHLEDGAQVRVGQGNALNHVTLHLDGATGYYRNDNNNDRHFIRDVSGDGNDLNGNEVLTIVGNNWTRLIGTLDGADVNINNNNNSNLQDGFSLGGNAVSMIQTGGGDRWLDVEIDPGAGTLNSTVASTNYNGINIYYGTDGSGGLTSDTIINVSNDNRVRLNVAGGGPPTVNDCQAVVNVLGNALLEAQESGGGTDGIAYFSNVNLSEGAVARLERNSDAIMANVNLLGPATVSNTRGGGWTCYLRDVTGTGPLTLEGTEEIRLLGTLDVDVISNNTDALRFIDTASQAIYNSAQVLPDGLAFNLNNHTVDLVLNNNDTGLWVDPGDGTIIATRTAAGYDQGNRNNWRRLELRYGHMQPAEGVAETAWGDNLEIVAGGQAVVWIRADEAAGADNVDDMNEDLYTNHFLGTIRVVDNVLPGELPNLGDNASWMTQCDAQLFGHRYTKIGDDDICSVMAENVVLEAGAMMSFNEDRCRVSVANVTVLRDTDEESPTYGVGTAYFKNRNHGDNHYIGDVWGDTGEGASGNEILQLLTTQKFHLNGIIHSSADVELVCYDQETWLEEGFGIEAGGNLRVIDGRIQIQDIDQVLVGHSAPGAPPTGDGAIQLMRPGGQTSNSGEMRLYYGKGEDPADLLGDNGWGAGGYNIEMYYANMVRLYVDEPDTGTNVNQYDGIIVTKSDANPATIDGRLRAERSDNRAGMGLAWFANIQPDVDSQTQLERGNETGIGAHFNLVNGDAEAVVNGGIPVTIEADSATPAVLTIDRNGGGNATLDLTILGSADMDIDNESGNVIRIAGLHLNGRTLTIRRTGSTVELWPECNTNVGGGLIDVAGYDTDPDPEVATWTRGQLEFRTNREGGDAVEAPAQIKVSHDGLLSGHVAQKYVQAVQNFPLVTITDDGTDRDAELRTRTSDTAAVHEGWTPGQVRFSSLTMGDGAKVELTKQDWGGIQSQLYIQNAHIEGAAEIYQNASLTGMFIGNTDGAGTLTVGGDMPTYLTGILAAGTRINGQAIVRPSATLTGPVEVAANGVCTLMPGVIAGTFTVKADGVLAISDAAFAGAATLETDGGVALAADLAWNDEDVNNTRIFIAKENYAGIITLDNPATVIGGTFDDRAGITQPLALADTATTVNFGLGDKALTLAGGVLHDTPLPNAVAVNFNQDVRITGASSHTGTNTIGDAVTPVASTVYAMDAAALGGGGGGGIMINDTAELRILADNFASGAIDVHGTPGALPTDPVSRATLDLRQPIVASAVNLTGGTIRAETSSTVQGAITDAAAIDFGDMIFNAGGTLAFSNAGGVALNANRTWTVSGGTAQFTGQVAGAVTLTKAGNGTLQLDGGVGAATSLILGTSPGGLTVIGAGGTVGAANSVLINAESAYGVKIVDHGYAEVDMTNSFGCIALGANSAATLTMLNPDMTLGACDDVAFTGTIAPASYTYKLGGGGATLTIADGVLSDYDDGMGGGPLMTNVQIGRSGTPAADDITHTGMVQVNGHQSVTGTVNIYGAAGVEDEDTFWATAPAGEAASVVNVQPGGSLDLGATVVANVQAVPNTTLVMLGGGVARNANGNPATPAITKAESWLLFDGFQDYVYGGGGEASDDNETKLEDGAADSTFAFNLVKVGTNQVRLLAPVDIDEDLDVDVDDQQNHYTTETRVEAGRLVVENVLSLGGATLFTVQGDGVAEFEAGGTLPFDATMALGGNARLEVVAGTLAAGGLTTSGNVTIAGNLDIGAAVVGGTGVATLEGGAPGTTLTAQYGDTSARFVAGEGSTLNFTTAANGSGIGTLMPNSLLTFGDADPLAVAVDANVAGGQALKFEAEAGGWSNGTDRVYTINVASPAGGDTSEIDLTSGDGLRSASYTDDADIAYRPVAHIQKTGEGTLRTAGDTFNAGSTTVTRKLAWDIVGGTLEATAGDGQGLGPDAYAWVMNDKQPTIANQHLESIDVRSGATLAWGGTHGFLEASEYYGDLPAGEGDGFKDTEFRMYDGSTLQGSNLQLGFYQAFAAPNGTDTYLCYPTLVGTSPVNVTFTGSINFDSGIAILNADPVNVTTAGNIRFSSSLAGAKSPDVIDTLTIQSGTTTIYKDHLAMQTTDIQGSGMLAFDPSAGPQITYNGTVGGTGAVSAVGGSTHVPGGGAPIGIAMLSVSNSTLVIDQPVTTTGYSAYEGGQLAYGWYNDVANTNLADIDDGVINAHNGGLFDLTPSPEASWPGAVQGKAIWTGEVWQDNNMSDTYCQMWSGYFKPPQDGDYEFYVHGDDFELLWIDENRNGDFEANGIEDVTVNVPPEGWDNAKTGTINLDAGEYYPFALAFSEGGGGDWINVTIKEPDGTAVRINPSVQTDWWYRGVVLPDATIVSGGTLDINALLTTGNVTVTGGGTAEVDTLDVANLITIGNATSTGALTAGATTATDLNLVNGTADLASLAASGTVNVGADTTAGALAAGPTTANAFNLTNGTANLASLTGTGATPTATVGANGAMTVTGAAGVTAMSNLTVLGTADVQAGPADAVTTTVGQGAPIVPPGGSAVTGSLTAAGANGQDLDIQSGTADYGSSAVNMTGTITIGSVHRDPAYAGDYVASVMADSPVAYYRFEEADNTLPAFDTSGNNHNGTYMNEATPVELAPGTAPMDGMLGKAVEFDGNTDSVKISDTIQSESISLETWFNADTLSGWHAILNREGWPTAAVHFQFYSNPLRFSINGNGSDTTFNDFTFNAGEWYHVVVTYDGSTPTDNVKLYVNGELEQTGSKPNTNDPQITPGDIGRWSGNNRDWDGYMDELAIYDTVLSLERVQAHYEGQSLVDPGSQPAPGTFVGGDTTANTVNLRNGSATLASLRGIGTDPSATVAASTTMNVASDIRGMSNITVGGILTTGAGVNVTDELTVEPGGTFDLTEGNLVVNYGAGANPFADLTALVAEGHAGGFPTVWEGTGITTSLGTAAGNPQGTTGLAIIDNDDPLREPGPGLPPQVGGKEELEGVPLPVDFKSILIGYTWTGDANFDGVLTTADYDLIDRAWLQFKEHGTPPDGGFRYAVGDFNYDGTLTTADYDLIDRAWLISGGLPLGGSGGPAPTPEPATLVLLGLGAAAALARKRRSR